MNYLIDTGPLVAYLDKRDFWHTWAAQKLNSIEPPLHTCEAVITEVVFLLLRKNLTPDPVFDFVDRGDLIIQPVFTTKAGQNRVRSIINTYQNLPASFADACLVRMAETVKNSHIFTLDNHFSIYRTSKSEPVSLISPF